MLNKAPLHEEVRVIGSVPPGILNVSIRVGEVVVAYFITSKLPACLRVVMFNHEGNFKKTFFSYVFLVFSFS